MHGITLCLKKNKKKDKKIRKKNEINYFFYLKSKKKFIKLKSLNKFFSKI